MTNIKKLIEPLLCLSTVHLTKETCDDFELGRQQGWPIFYPNEYGAFVFVSSDQYDREVWDGPEDLATVMRFARAHGVVWIKFDGDGLTVDDLPTYESTWSN